MFWKTRGSLAFGYRSVRVGGRVATRYVPGSGRPAAEAVAIKRRESERRAERASALADWVARRQMLAEDERGVIDADRAYGELAEAAMTAVGYHRPGRGRWRRRRASGAGDERALATLRDLLEGDHGRFGPSPSREVVALRHALAGPEPGVLETRLAERAARAWFDALGRDIVAEEAVAAKKSPLEVDFRDGQRTRAGARFLAAARALAEVRRLALSSLPALFEGGPSELIHPITQALESKQIMSKTARDDDRPDRILSLIQRSTQGDHDAFEALRASDKAVGIDRVAGWSQDSLRVKLESRASPKNLLARAGVSHDLRSVARDLAEPSDGPIERLLVKRAAVGVVDAGLADLEHVRAVPDGRDPAALEALDRRRDRAHRRLLQTLKTLAQVRRLNRVAVQVNVGDGNLNILKA